MIASINGEPIASGALVAKPAPWVDNTSVNLYSDEVANIKNGYYDEHGNFYGNTNYISLKMPVKPSTTYTVSHNRHYMTFWDLDDAFVGYAGQASADLDDYTFTTPARASWVILTLSASYDKSEYMMVEGDTMPSTYVEADYRLSDGVYVPNNHEIAYLYANNTAYPSVDWSAGTIRINGGLILARDSAVTSIPAKTLTMQEGYGLLLVTSGTWDVTIAPLTQVSQQKGQYAIGYYINVPSVQVVYIYGLGYIYSTRFVTHLTPMNVMMAASETNIRATYDATADTLTIVSSGGFTMYNYVANTNSLPAINLTIESASSHAALIFYQDSTEKAVKWADWANWSSLPPSSLILGYRYGMRLFMFGRTVTFKINRGTTDTASVKYASCVFGDSITAGVNSAMPYHYDDMVYGYRENKNFGVGSSGYIVNASGSVVVADGVYGAGTRTTAPAQNTIKKRIEQYGSSIESGDAIVIAAGTNDYSSSAVTLESFETAIRECYEYVLSNFTNPLIVCTPIHRQTETNSQGETLRQYVDKIKEVCSDMGIPVIDFYENVQLHPERSDWRTLYIPDGLHPNQRGHRLMSWFFGSEMNKYVGDSTR